MSTAQSFVHYDQHEDEIDLPEIWRVLRRHARKVAAFALAGTVVAIMYIIFATPQFAVNGGIYLGDARTSMPAGQTTDFGYLSNLQSNSDVDTQIELVKSHGLVEQAVLASGLNAEVKGSGAQSLSEWKWALLYGRSIAAYAPRPGDLQAVNAVIADQSDAAETFKIVMGDQGHYRIIQGGGWFSATVPVLSGVLGQPASGGGLSLVLKPAIVGAVPSPGTSFKLTVESADAVTTRLLARGQLSVVNGSILNVNNPAKIADLQFTGADPYAARNFVAALMSNFVATQSGWDSEAAAATETFIASQLDRVSASLAGADQKLAAYQSQTGILDVPENAKAVIGELSQYGVQRTSIRLQQQALQQINNELAHPSGPLNPYLISQSGDAVLGQMSSNLADAEEKLQILQSQFTQNAPDVQVQQAAVANIEASVRSLVGNDLTLADHNLQNIDSLIAQSNAELKNMPAESLQIIALTRASDSLGQVYQVLIQKEEDAEVSKAATINKTRIITPAELPLTASSPKALIITAIGFFVGLFGGIAATLGQLSLSGRFQSDEEIRRMVPLPVYGLIPMDATIEGDSNVFPLRPQSPFLEALRLLRGNLYRSAAGAGSGTGARVVLMTSADVNDGKTTISVNLAKMLADDGKRVILVDADLHLGRLHEILKIDPSAGLTQWVVTKVKPRFQAVPGQRFMMLPAGLLPPNPSELLNDRYFAEIIAALRAEFDFVIIDSPPLPAVSDGIALGHHADVILSVVMIERTIRRAFAVHQEMLGTLARSQGIVINGVAADRYGYGYRYNGQRKAGGGAMALLRNTRRAMGLAP